MAHRIMLCAAFAVCGGCGILCHASEHGIRSHIPLEGVWKMLLLQSFIEVKESYGKAEVRDG